MNPLLLASNARPARLAPFGPWLVLALGVVAYRALLPGSASWPSRGHFEDWLFAPEQKAPLLAIAVCVWMVWCRRDRLHTLAQRCDTGLAVLLAATGVGLYLWTVQHQSTQLLLVSLAANLLALASGAKGWPGCRLLLLPVAVLLLGAPLPAPLRDELVWRLQLVTTDAAAWMLRTAGFDVLHSGIQMWRDPFTFNVVASCSGLRGMEVLTLFAFAVREHFAASGRRQWLLVLAAAPLGMALNLLRVSVVVAVASSGEPRPPDTGVANHAIQGLVLLLVGVGLLIGLGRWLSSGDRATQGLEPEPTPVGARSLWGTAAAGLAVLAAISFAGKPSAGAPAPFQLELPLRRAGWDGADLAVDHAFFGPLPAGTALHRRYARDAGDGPPKVVDLFVAFEAEPAEATSGLFTSRSVVPGREWSISAPKRRHIGALGLDADVAAASRPGGEALVYRWRLRDAGLWAESARSLLGLGSAPGSREERRAIVRLVTPLRHGGQDAQREATSLLERFIGEFRDDLVGL